MCTEWERTGIWISWPLRTHCPSFTRTILIISLCKLKRVSVSNLPFLVSLSVICHHEIWNSFLLCVLFPLSLHLQLRCFYPPQKYYAWLAGENMWSLPKSTYIALACCCKKMHRTLPVAMVVVVVVVGQARRREEEYDLCSHSCMHS